MGNGPPSAGLPLKHGVPIGQTINFQDCRVTVISAYPGQVRCKVEVFKTDKNGNPIIGELSGMTRTKTVPRSEYDKWVEASKPAGETPPAPTDGRRVKIMRVSPSGNPAVTWEDSEFEKLADGDVFMLFEADGTEVPGGPSLACGPAYQDTENGGCWTVDCVELKLEDAEQFAPLSGDPDLAL